MAKKDKNVKVKTQGSKKAKGLDMRKTLIMFGMIPLVTTSLIIGLVSIIQSSKEIKDQSHDSLIQVIENVGSSFDTIAAKNGNLLMGFSKAPIVKEALLHPEDASLQAQAQAYTMDYFSTLEGWEGIYVADWNSQVITHNNEGAIGMVLREGDALTGLQNNILSADGVFNTGILTSPVSGQNIMSMYCAVMDGDTPIGFVGCGTYVSDISAAISDVSALGFSTAYIYYVDSQGTMLYHPDESKIGNPVENAAVKGLVAGLEKGESPDPEVIVYNYKGKVKYAAYYIGEGDNYIAVLTADEDEVLGGVTHTRNAIIIIILVCIVFFTIIGLLLERVISIPLIKVSEVLAKLAGGDVTVETDAHSHIYETKNLIASFRGLRDALSSSMNSVKLSASVLNKAIVDVDGMTGKNVDSVSQINTAIGEVADTSQAVAENAQVMASRAIELGDNIESLNSNVSTLYEASQTIKNANNDATDCMQSVYAGANESVGAMNDITSKITETNQAIGEIEAAVQAIESIAAQTNLLSLNASIEAARAGEAGKGFAVVADEIRSLADSSAESAKEIKLIIENVTELSNGTVEMSNRVFEVINREQTDIEQAQEKFNVLSDSVETAITEINTIRGMADKLGEIKDELTKSTTDLGAISEELGASAQEVAASCQTVTEACSDTQNSTTEMRSINEDMSAAIDFFKLGE
ncbi:MAG: methyl-accepting chemotaxis protein [Lachnospiraceae bacterium]|nr:methyl-accepting chemotaxis protein [Lachnospiraceae bacterium]